jgi:hypothetical protein
MVACFPMDPSLATRKILDFELDTNTKGLFE